MKMNEKSILTDKFLEEYGLKLEIEPKLLLYEEETKGCLSSGDTPKDKWILILPFEQEFTKEEDLDKMDLYFEVGDPRLKNWNKYNQDDFIKGIKNLKLKKYIEKRLSVKPKFIGKKWEELTIDELMELENYLGLNIHINYDVNLLRKKPKQSLEYVNIEDFKTILWEVGATDVVDLNFQKMKEDGILKIQIDEVFSCNLRKLLK